MDRQDWSSILQESSNTGVCLQHSIPNTAQSPLLGRDSSLTKTLESHGWGLLACTQWQHPTPLSLTTPAPRDGILAQSYLSHSCLHNLQAQLMLQLSLHLLC